MIVDAGEGVGEPGLGIDVVELCGLDEGVYGGSPVAAGIGAAEGPVAASDGDATQGAFGGRAGPR
jgi:hypothetical protein